jgi:hypothetical protein
MRLSPPPHTQLSFNLVGNFNLERKAKNIKVLEIKIPFLSYFLAIYIK